MHVITSAQTACMQIQFLSQIVSHVTCEVANCVFPATPSSQQNESLSTSQKPSTTESTTMSRSKTVSLSTSTSTTKHLTTTSAAVAGQHPT